MSKRKCVNAYPNEILQNKSSKSTINQRNSHIRSFQEFSSFIKCLDINLKTTSLKHLDLLLRDFYASLRNGDELYKRNCYLSIRQTLNRELKSIIDPQIDIINDKGNFPMSIELFGCLLKTVKKEGRGNKDHYSDISRNDFQAVSKKLDINVGLPPSNSMVLIYYHWAIFLPDDQKPLELFLQFQRDHQLLKIIFLFLC